MKKDIELAARKAGKLLLDYFGKVEGKDKGTRDIVTEADFASEKLLEKELLKTGLAESFLGEESGWSNKSDTFWVVDPLDGTVNYAMGNPLFGLNIALVKDGKTIAGASYMPYFKEYFYAEKGKGAFLNGVRFKCPKVPAEKSVVFCTWGYSNEKQIRQGERYEHRLLERVLRVRNPGTLALGLAYVACGRYSGCIHNQAKPWDITAGNLMIEEAGGKVTDFNGKKWSPFMKTMVAGNALNHKALLEAVK